MDRLRREEREAAKEMVMSKQTEPTAQDVRTLAFAPRVEQRHGEGIFPRNGGQTSHFDKLCRFGMLEFTGEWGHDMDGEVERDVPIYRLTEQGRTWIRAQEARA
jgi:hypothetical protein